MKDLFLFIKQKIINMFKWLRSDNTTLLLEEIKKYHTDLLKEAKETSNPETTDKLKMLEALGFTNLSPVLNWKEKSLSMKKEKELILEMNAKYPYIFVPKEKMEQVAVFHEYKLREPQTYFGSIPQEIQNEIFHFVETEKGSFNIKVLAPKHAFANEEYETPVILFEIEDKGYLLAESVLK
jgi:hypothetical protein